VAKATPPRKKSRQKKRKRTEERIRRKTDALRTRGAARGQDGRVATTTPDDAQIEKGYEFGVPFYAMATSLPDFVGALGEAKVVGCLYGGETHPDFGELPFLGIIATQPRALTTALADLHRRTQPPGGDLVILGFQLSPGGGYQLSISLDPEDLARRLLPGNYLNVPLSVVTSWHFFLNSTDQQLLKIKRWKEENPLYPLLLGGATTNAAGVIRPCGTVVPVFNVHFSEKKSGTPEIFHPMAGAAQHVDRDGDPPRYTSAQVVSRSREVLRRYFPLTTGSLGSLLAAPTCELEWQRAQALCNLAVSTEIFGRVHYIGASSGSLSTTIERHLKERIETKPLRIDDFPVGHLDRQLLLDRLSLDSYLNG
jgi:hypothetical protein